MSNTSTSKLADLYCKLKKKWNKFKHIPSVEPWVDPTAPFEPFPIHPPFDETFTCPLETLLRGVTKWYEEYRGINIELRYAGYRFPDKWGEGSMGLWCYYIHVMEGALKPDDWKKLSETYTVEGRKCVKDDFWNEIYWHGGVTYAQEREQYYDRAQQKMLNAIKIGCDFGHHFDQNNIYEYEDVLREAKRTVDEFLALVHVKIKCGYSGIYDEPENFYTAINGRTIHINANIPDDWDTWKPKLDA